MAVLAVPEARKGEAVSPERVVDLTKQMDAQGRLTWDAPPGKWTVVRLGVASENGPNHPAPPEAMGLECDRMDPAAVLAVFEGMTARIVREARAQGYKSVQRFETDSYEAGRQGAVNVEALVTAGCSFVNCQTTEPTSRAFKLNRKVSTVCSWALSVVETMLMPPSSRFLVKAVVRSAETGCAVYLDATASPSGLKHGGARCRCVPIHGPDEMASVVKSIRTLLASEGPGPGLFFEKPSYEISLILLGVVAPGRQLTRARPAASPG